MSIPDMSKDVLNELAQFVLGKRLGSGMSREVFTHPFDETKVIKVENSAGNFQNVAEWQTWQTYNFCPDVARWLAPCHAISHSGTFLIMDRARDLLPKEIPEKLPDFLTDHKPENYGILNGKVVCRDYGYITTNVKTTLRKWRG